jgi:shikimate dehydrogenase
LTPEAIRLAVLGHPLAFTRSPELHRAGLHAIGLECESRAIPTPPGSLRARLDELSARGYLGVNLTVPLKEAVLPYLARVGDDARRARSVNTVALDRGGFRGETTDGAGFVALLRSLNRPPLEQRVVLLGAGGSARSLALALLEAAVAALDVCARRPLGDAWGDIAGARRVEWQSPECDLALARATLVVHCTPIADRAGPVPLESIVPTATIIDLRYEERLTPWIVRARAAGFHAWDGLGLLVFQAQRSLAILTGREIPLEPMARAVGWPR